ncbi:DUF2975 domain-containing protein [Euzebyella marina]|uniref:DUF2975 domain-containing protein n=1 Tax=Euzebyella marina TaxID=1761453 RepID=A0A3G2L809_9FLAO|nr:DUF2975 domain-containing protein [Euzebyella marina]AYN68395.1 DUF2975 domain-containing protein [Euzebyella marina]
MVLQNRLHKGLLINFLLIIFQIGFLTMILGLALYILFTVISIFTDSPSFPTGFTVMFSLDQNGLYNMSEQITGTTFNLNHAMGVIGLDQVPLGFLIGYSSISLLAYFCVLFGLRLTIRILESAKLGDFLITENAIRLRSIAFLGIGCIFFDRLSTIIASSYLYDKLEYPGLKFASTNLFTFTSFQSVFFFLFLWLIAEAFRIGSQLKLENDLTI